MIPHRSIEMPAMRSSAWHARKAAKEEGGGGGGGGGGGRCRSRSRKLVYADANVGGKKQACVYMV